MKQTFNNIKRHLVGIYYLPSNRKYALSQSKILSYYYYYYILLKNEDKTEPSNKKIIFDLKNGTPDRYLYAIMTYFKLADYSVYIKSGYNFLSTCNGLYLDKIFTHLRIKKFRRNRNRIDEFDLLITDNEVNYMKSDIKTGLIEFSKPFNIEDTQLPFSFHPLIYANNNIQNNKELENLLNQKRNNKKQVRIFFGGNYNHPSYENLKTNFPQYLNRNQVINFIINNLPKESIENKNFDELKIAYYRKFICIHKDKANYKPIEWLDIISKSDFFLCPPGFEMPHSHNLIEAMACGVIPIIQYGELLEPPLEDMHNCITFRNKEDLLSRMKLVLNMPQVEIDIIRKNAILYYKENLSPYSFTRKVELLNKNKFNIKIVGGQFSFD